MLAFSDGIRFQFVKISGGNIKIWNWVRSSRRYQSGFGGLWRCFL